MLRFLLLLVTVALTLTEVVQVQVISRHCSRTPIYDGGIPNFPIDWETLFNLGEGQLTPLGERRCYNVGQRIKQRYLHKSSPNAIRDISTKFSSDFKFYSTNYDRTIFSVSYIANAMFSEVQEVQNTNISRPVPVFSFPKKQDVLLRLWDKCPKIDQKIVNSWTNSEWLEKKKMYSPFIEMLGKLTGRTEARLENFLEVSDEILMAKEHDVLHPTLDPHYDKIVEISNFVQYFNYSRDMIGNLGGKKHNVDGSGFVGQGSS